MAEPAKKPAPPNTGGRPSTAGSAMRGPALYVALVLTGFMVAIAAVQFFSDRYNALPAFRWIGDIDRRLADYKFTLRGKEKVDPRIALVAIDEKTLDQLGRWPFSRAESAKLIRALTEQEVAVIGFDVLYSEKDTCAVNTVKSITELQSKFQETGLAGLDLSSACPAEGACGESVKKAKSSALQFSGQLESMLTTADYDAEIGEAIKKHGHTVVSFIFFTGREEAESLSPETRQLNDRLIQPSVVSVKTDRSVNTITVANETRALGVLPNREEITQGSHYQGFVNSFPDLDGVVRSIRAFVPYDEDWVYPALSIETYSAWLDSQGKDAMVQVHFGVDGVKGMTIGGQAVPVTRSGRLIINYQGPAKTFPHYSWVDVANGKLPPGTLKDKIVIVGATAVAVGDVVPTPFMSTFPGPEVHANVINSLLTGNYLYKPDSQKILEIFALALMGLVATLLLLTLRPSVAMGASLLLLVGYLVANYLLFIWARVNVSAILFIAELFLVNFGIILYRYFTEEKQKKFIKGAFSQYLSPHVIEQLIDDPDMLNLGGEERVCTAFFSDVAGFSSISEKLTATELVSLLNDYLTEMTNIILEMDGTVDKYEGDAIVAFFGAPVAYEDHPRRACIAAIRQQRRLEELRAKWKSEGRPELKARIGLNTGRMLIGNMGSATRMNYTMMGDAVNLASRLEGANKPYGTYMMISESTYEAAKDAIEARELDLLRVVGKAQPVRVYELLEEKGRLDDKTRALLKDYNEGLDCYRRREFKAALAAFERVVRQRPDDGPGRAYVARCRAFIETPPSADWDGVFALTEK